MKRRLHTHTLHSTEFSKLHDSLGIIDFPLLDPLCDVLRACWYTEDATCWLTSESKTSSGLRDVMEDSVAFDEITIAVDLLCDVLRASW